jgi:hypothetical protein
MESAEPDHAKAASFGVFAMDPETTLRELARHLVVGQGEIADLARRAHIVRALRAINGDLSSTLAEWDGIQQRWVTERLPSLIAAMKLALEVYDTFGPGMTRIDEPIDAGIWNNKYFVWERELSPAFAKPDRLD